ncbi:MAG TPA: AIR synthase-related protein [Candidatus Saccharimonadales bacterium]|nr:AIR synthase-related protein [Candidatus Saccharimonadales bacterium]
MKKQPQQTYAETGVDYSAMDPIKVLAQQAASRTAPQLSAFDAHEISESRGESAYVWEEHDAYRALVVEGLGTKNLVADAMRAFTGKTYYDSIAQDTVAMIVNDLIVVGALPQVVNAYFAIGNSDWMRDEVRARDLIDGWAAACVKSGATWGGGETPALKGIINPDTIDLGGSAVGIINPKDRLVLGDKLTAGDVIVLVESSGIHANGITFVRSLADKDPGLYTTSLSDGRLFGEAILTPTHLYVALVRDIQEAHLDVHYMVNITGHGWRKLMRATQKFSYVIDKELDVPPEFLLMQELSGASDTEMYGNFNMGAGFAIYLSQNDAKKVVEIAGGLGLKAIIAGKVEDGPSQVTVKSKNITFSGDTLEVRG